MYCRGLGDLSIQGPGCGHSGSRGGGGCPSHDVDDGTKVLGAPMPFLCGIDTRHFADMMEDLADECIMVDLVKNMVSVGTEYTTIT